MPRGIPDLEQELPPLEEQEEPPEPEEREPEQPTPVRRKHRAVASSTRSAGSRSARTPRSPSPSKSDKDIEEIRIGVEDLFTEIGVWTAPFLPYTSTVSANRAGESADRMARLAEADPRVRRALLRMVRYNAYLGVARIVSYMGTAVAVDVGAITPDSLIADRLIGKEIAIVHEQRTSAQAAAANGAGVPEPQWATTGNLG